MSRCGDAILTPARSTSALMRWRSSLRTVPPSIVGDNCIQNCKVNTSALSPKSSNNTSGTGFLMTCGCSAAACAISSVTWVGHAPVGDAHRHFIAHKVIAQSPVNHLLFEELAVGDEDFDAVAARDQRIAKFDAHNLSPLVIDLDDVTDAN